MIGYHECDYREDRAPVTTAVACDHGDCCQRAVGKCRNCGDSVCDEHSSQCEERGCEGSIYCRTCTHLVDSFRLCHRHESQHMDRQEAA